MQIEPGMRMRCVDAAEQSALTQGGEYISIRGEQGIFDTPLVWVADDNGQTNRFFFERFKPVVRVKAGRR
jgi:hypothetical protein